MELLPFFLNAGAEVLDSGKQKNAIKENLQCNLKLRGIEPDSPALQSDWTLFINKLLRFRPRMVGAIASYSLLSGLSYAEIKKNEGMEAFRVMWYLGSSQDDLIDNAGVEDEKGLKRAIFGPEKVFYQAGYSVFINSLHKGTVKPETQFYLKSKTADWYKFLLKQEAQVIQDGTDQYSFQYCRKYRETQNGNIGSLLTACLNGTKALDPQLRQLENVVPKLSYRTQIIDDIADLPEDIAAERPSYAVSALQENPTEMRYMMNLLNNHPELGKVTPRLMASKTPDSFKMLKDLYDDYGNFMSRTSKSGQLLTKMGDTLFYGFPIYRDIMFRLNPQFANF